MHEVLRDPDVMSGIIRRRVLRAMVPAVRMLDRVARGASRFTTDQERIACVVLARLAPVAMAHAAAGDELAEEYVDFTANWTPERRALWEKVQRLNAPPTREAGADAWAEEFLKGEDMPVGVDTLEKAREHGRVRFEESQAHSAYVDRLLAEAKRQNQRNRRRR